MRQRTRSSLWQRGGAIASNSTLTLADPISTVSILDLDGTMAISQLHVTGSQKLN